MSNPDLMKAFFDATDAFLYAKDADGQTAEDHPKSRVIETPPDLSGESATKAGHRDDLRSVRRLQVPL
jgi:hypothetical protein